MKETLKQIINELKEVVIEEKLNITDSELIDLSLRIYITQSINKSKSNLLKNELSPKERLIPQENEGLATPNQKAFLRKQKIMFKEDLTKKEAYLLIKGIKDGTNR